jgi:3-oxoacyl-[acyl-carrier-protein] synthase II
MGEAAIRFGLTGESYIVNEPSASGTTALALAIGSLDAGESDTIVCGRCDLGRPSLLESSHQVAAGALFFVLENAMASQRSYYGELDQTPDGQIVFNRETIPDLTTLAHECLRMKPRFP